MEKAFLRKALFLFDNYCMIKLKCYSQVWSESSKHDKANITHASVPVGPPIPPPPQPSSDTNNNYHNNNNYEGNSNSGGDKEDNLIIAAVQVR